MSFLLFEINWFGAVLGSVHGLRWLGPVLLADLLLLYLLSDRSLVNDWPFLAGAAAIGFGVDTAMVAGGVFSLPGGTQSGTLSPPHMVGLWVNLSVALLFCLSWLRRRYLAASILGAVAGPLAYWSGARLGGIILGSNVLTALLCLALVWALCLPLLLQLRERAIVTPPQAH